MRASRDRSHPTRRELVKSTEQSGWNLQFVVHARQLAKLGGHCPAQLVEGEGSDKQPMAHT
eukprot:1026981-Pleurochrysis_carterae.AAC.2